MAAMIGSGMVARSIPYGEGFGAKQLAWAVHCGVLVIRNDLQLIHYYKN